MEFDRESKTITLVDDKEMTIAHEVVNSASEDLVEGSDQQLEFLFFADSLVHQPSPFPLSVEESKILIRSLKRAVERQHYFKLYRPKILEPVAQMLSDYNASLVDY